MSLSRVIVHTSSVIVPQTDAASYINYVRFNVFPCYLAAEGLVSVRVSKREVVAYFEVLTISIWRSDEALRKFIESNGAVPTKDWGLISLEPHSYELLYSSTQE